MAYTGIAYLKAQHHKQVQKIKRQERVKNILAVMLGVGLFLVSALNI